MNATKYKKQTGFTLVEVMVSTAIFLVIVLGCITALVVSNKNYKVTQETRQQLDTVSFAMEDMVRNMRIGNNFHCMGVAGEPADIEVPFSCVPAGYSPGSMNSIPVIQQSLGIAFEGINGKSGDPTDQIAYQFFADSSRSNADGSVSTLGHLGKSIPGTAAGAFNTITPPSILIDIGRSGFTVFGAEQAAGYPDPTGEQPRILIRITGELQYQEVTIPFTLQTTVTPRSPDA